MSAILCGHRLVRDPGDKHHGPFGQKIFLYFRTGVGVTYCGEESPERSAVSEPIHFDAWGLAVSGVRPSTAAAAPPDRQVRQVRSSRLGEAQTVLIALTLSRSRVSSVSS